MCDTCGCGQPDNIVTITRPGSSTHSHPGHEHEHKHDHSHDHEHNHEHHHHHTHDEGPSSKTVDVEQDVLSRNNLLAERNRGYFEAKGLFVLNLVSSPGAGKTTLLEESIKTLKDDINFAVIEGDQQTLRDASRIEAVGADAIQINTGSGCHLDAGMINRAVKSLNPAERSILMIENVGNLVCPALFDLGEAKKVVIISATEGDDKPLKYPTMFQVSDICIINKTDLLPYVDFDMEKCMEYARKVNPNLSFFTLSARTGDGMDGWYDWLKQQVKRE